MLDRFFQRNDVLKFMEQLKTNERYFQKNNNILNSFVFDFSELALYIFYDALWKYQLIIEDEDFSFFPEFMEQLEKLYRKVDNFESIRIGIHKLICRILLKKMNLEDSSQTEREIIIRHIYQKYILEGYFIHGFPSVYADYIKNQDFYPEEYPNYYNQFIEVNKIFERYKVSPVLLKDFYEKKVYFTDDIVMGCYYSLYAPMFFYQFLRNEEFKELNRTDYSLKEDYLNLISPLKRFMNYNMFRESDKKYILDLVKKQWDFLHQVKRDIQLFYVKRSVVTDKVTPLSEFLDMDEDLFEVVDRLLSSKYNTIGSDRMILKSDMNFLSFSSSSKENVKSLKEEMKKDLEEDASFLDKNGNVSFLLVLGCLLISLGVILSIFIIFRG